MYPVGSSDCSSKESRKRKNNREEAFYGDGPFNRAACPGGAGGERKGRTKRDLGENTRDTRNIKYVKNTRYKGESCIYTGGTDGGNPQRAGYV